MKRNAFFKNACILTVTSLLLRSAGMVFRIFLSDRIGSEGMGLYQLIVSVYVLGSAFATCGISTAVTRLVTEALAAGHYRNARRVLRRAMWLSFGIGVLSALIIALGAGPIAHFILQDERAVFALRIMGVAFPFMGITACLRGYFLARRRVKDTSGAQIFEQIVRMGLSWFLLWYFADRGVSFACCAVMIGDTAAEAAACFLLWLRYRKDSRTALQGGTDTPHPVLRPLLAIALPITAGRYLNTVLRTIENILVPHRLTAYCHSREQALASFGALKGMALPLLFFPSSFLSALSTLLIPEVSEADALGQSKRIERAVTQTLRITLLSSLFISGVFFLYADVLGLSVYHNDEVGFFLRMLAPLMPVMYAESVVDGILKGLNQQLSSLKYSVWDSVIRIVMIVLMVAKTGMLGFLFIMLISNLLTCFLNIHRLLKVSGVRFLWGRWVLLPVLAIVCSGAIVWGLQRLLSLSENLLALIAGSALLLPLYVLLLMWFGCLKRSELPFFSRFIPYTAKEVHDPLIPHDAPRQERI